MKILQVNKFFYVRGGSSRYFFETSNLLQSYGHEIAYFSMRCPRNEKSEWSKYFVDYILFNDIEPRQYIKVVLKMFYSFEARRKLSKLLDEFKPDIVHLHSIYHHLSPSIIFELKNRNIPIVQTVHDYHLISPNHTLFHDGKICEVTKPNHYYKAIFHKCVKKSYIASLAEALEQYTYYFLNINKYVDTFIAPSRFLANKLIEYGIDKNKIQILHSFCDIQNFKPNFNEGIYILYFGRLSPEKGLNYLFKAMKFLPNVPIKIVGIGSMEEELKRMVIDLRLKNVEFLGFQNGEKLKQLISKSKFTILPSVCYEIFPLSVLEAFTSGKPVIGSEIGGIPESVKNGYDGFLFEPGNAEDLAEKISYLWSHPALCREMGRNAREYVEKNFGPEEHYEKLMDIYKMAIAKHK